MKYYLKTITLTQKILIDISILILLSIPIILVFYENKITETVYSNLYLISHLSLFFVMFIRPLSDIVRKTKLLRPLVILRKGGGILSASIIVSFILAKIIISPLGYFSSIFTEQYWSMENFAFLAHLGDLSAILLLVTSNNLSKKIFGSWWKKIQKLSYLYFYSSSLYVLFTYGDLKMLYFMLIVTFLTTAAYFINKNIRINKLQTQYAN